MERRPWLEASQEAGRVIDVGDSGAARQAVVGATPRRAGVAQDADDLVLLSEEPLARYRTASRCRRGRGFRRWRCCAPSERALPAAGRVAHSEPIRTWQRDRQVDGEATLPR